MSVGYQAVGWNRQKRRYDMTLVGAVVLYLGAFVGLGFALHPEATVETLLIRAFGTGALVSLHIVLCIGPLCRLDRRFLPLLYNRRHLGVVTFVLGLAHGGLALLQFHAFGVVDPLVSLFSSDGSLGVPASFPFQPLGFAALVILFLMAATSHDFWLHNLGAPVWKALHMGVYLAYALVVMHVALGVLQQEPSPLFVGALGLGMVLVLGLHGFASRREAPADREHGGHTSDDGFIEVCTVDEIPEDRARVVCVGGERVAVYRWDGKVSAISSVCQHQNGPLGEGRVIDGCITCPWHGYQYLPETGASPPPFEESVPTFGVRLEGRGVWIDPRPHPPGTRIDPARIGGNSHGASEEVGGNDGQV